MSRRSARSEAPHPKRPGPRGFAGPGLGRASYVEAPPEWRGTSVQVCGLYPWIVGATVPTIGVPIGRHMLSGAAVCFDPINWFQRAKVLLNPSMFVLGLPGLGKSTLVRRLVLGLAAGGVTVLVLGDLKPDYAELVKALGGQVIRLGRGAGSLNVLDPGAMGSVARMLRGARAKELSEQAMGRRLNMITALVTLVRRRPISDHEESVLSAALRVLDDRNSGVPVLHDLVDVLKDAPDRVRQVTLDRGDDARYRESVDPLTRSLLGLIDGPLGSTFARHTSEPIDVDSTAVCVDISNISSSDTRLQAAILLACWNEGFGAVEAAQALTDAGEATQRHFFIVMDELWRVVRSGEGMVDNIDALTRLNRQKGVGTAMITHSMADLRALRNPEDREKAEGFVERSGALVVGGLPPAEMEHLNTIVPFFASERREVTHWATPPGWDANTAPPGLGNFLIKVGGRAGIPVNVQLTETERRTDVHNTNRQWEHG